RIDPNNEAVYYSLGHSYSELSRYHLERSNVYNQLGRGDLAKYHRELAKKYEQLSIEHYRESIKRQPHIFEAYHNLVLVLINAETPQLEEALRIAKYLANSKNPRYFKDLDEFNYNVGNIYIKMGKFENAIPYFQRAIRLNPKDMKYYNDLGAAYASIGKLDVAEKIWRYILKQDPLHEAAESNLKKLTSLKKRYGTLPIPSGQEFKFVPPNVK
ncbi:MAG: tetratricopeptide repeat protein, partial [Candidatus Sumerlaeia bacterium]|nr:tetratricopeptide repeat protein [Candidatus Sumerlaeia bacterium]